MKEDMTGLVLELQRDALNKSVDVGDLLRKALAISRKLDQPDIRRWIELELYGYGELNIKEAVKYAAYRSIKGELVCFNPYKGWIPLSVPNPEIAETLRKKYISQSLAQIEDLISKGPNDSIYMKFSEKQKAMLMSGMSIPLEPAVSVNRQSVVGIIDSVRSKILEWALLLEEKGVKGEHMSFSQEEKITANSITHTTINNIGRMTNSQLQQHSSGIQKIVNKDDKVEVVKILDAIASVIEQLKLSADSESELRAEIETIKIQLASSKPKQSVIKDCLLSAKNILEGAAGNILATGIASQIPAVIALLGTR